MFVELLITSVVAIIGWFILMLVSTNVLGLFVRGFFKDPVLNVLDDAEREKTLPSGFINSERKERFRANSFVNITAFILFVGFLFLLFYFLGVFALLAALMIMVSRFPDLIWEIKHGRKIAVATMPRGTIFYLTSLLDWMSFPVFWYSIYLILTS